MIYVIATFTIKPNNRTKFLEIFKNIIPTVQNELGCIEYFPTIDINSGLSLQTIDENVVTIIEKWANLETLNNHIKSKHMQIFIEKITNIIENTTVKILQKIDDVNHG